MIPATAGSYQDSKKVSFTGLRMSRPLEIIKLRLIFPVQRNSDFPESAGWFFSFTKQSLDTDCAGVLQKRMLQMKCVLCFSSALDKLWSTLSDAYGAAHVNRVLVPVFSYIFILFKLLNRVLSFIAMWTYSRLALIWALSKSQCTTLALNTI